MLRFAYFYADRQQTTDDRQYKPIALPLAAHARTRGDNLYFNTWMQIINQSIANMNAGTDEDINATTLTV